MADQISDKREIIHATAQLLETAAKCGPINNIVSKTVVHYIDNATITLENFIRLQGHDGQ